MTPQNLFVATMGLCLVNGLISPMLGLVWMLHPVWMPEMVPLTNETVFYGASLLVSTATLLLSAVPAAIAERLGLPLAGRRGVAGADRAWLNVPGACARAVAGSGRQIVHSRPQAGFR
jgi:hypothetical protein